MKTLNTKSDCYYLDKMVGFRPLNISKVHIIDDDCNEFIATVIGIAFMHGYISPSEINIIACEEYTQDKWEAMTRYAEYERVIIA